MAYVRLNDGTTVEIFWRGAHCDEHENGDLSCHECAMNAGWYWWPCLPGCLPDCSIPSGPFATQQEALDDASDS